MNNPAMDRLGYVINDLTELAFVNTLPHVDSLTIGWSYTREVWEISGQVAASYDEADRIDAIRTWAAMFKVPVSLSDAKQSSYHGTTYRTLSVSIDWSGTEVTVWTHLAETITTALIAA